jgi:hypothetical protein
MTRRDALRSCFIITVGATLIPSCLQDKDKSSIALKNIKIDGKQEKLIAELAETIIPKTDTPGAKDVYAHLFILKMVDDCYEKEGQQQFMKGLDEFEKLSKKKFDKSFVELSQPQRVQLVTEVNNNNDNKVDDDVTYFYKAVKRFTSQAYTTSKYYLTSVQEWKLVPGTFKGCVPVSSNSIS